MAYRISFTLIGGSDSKIHIIRKLGELPLCGAIPMTFHKLINLDEMRRSKWCDKCLDTYHRRPEKEFAVIK